jgi:hypothetical protein
MDTQRNNFDFHGSISRQVLENYLSRSITMAKFLTGAGCPEDNLRMIAAIKPKFIGRAICQWSIESQLSAALRDARNMAQRVYEIDPQIILQAGIFETVSTEVEGIPVPALVFEEFDLQPQARNFSYRDMLFQDGSYLDHWRPGASVPDITRQETQMWFFYQAVSYINVGIEALHLGQVQLVGRDDPQLRTWFALLDRVRRYASHAARRGMVICDAHVSSGVNCYGLTPFSADAPLGYSLDGRLLLDVHALPMRVKEVSGVPQQAELAVGHLDSIYGRSMGGITPSGWSCDHLPYLVDIDCYGNTGHGGESVVGKLESYQGIDNAYWVWGWDEICWFANQPAEQRNAWLWYAWQWIRDNDPNGFMEMPGQQFMADPAGFYHANRPSAECPGGYGQEDTIAAIWKSDQR